MTQPRYVHGGIGRNFDRAENIDGGGLLGDPERWGDSQSFSLTFPANTTLTIVKTTRQLVRVQVPQLIARKWGMVCTWEFFSDDPLVTLTRIDVDAVIGVGQSSLGVPLQAFPVPNTQTPFTNAASGSGGATDLGEVIAAAINARLRVSVHAAAPASPAVVRAIVGLAASPRSL